MQILPNPSKPSNTGDLSYKLFRASWESHTIAESLSERGTNWPGKPRREGEGAGAAARVRAVPVADDGCGIFLSLSRVNIAPSIIHPAPIITALEIFWATIAAEIRGDDAITQEKSLIS